MEDNVTFLGVTFVTENVTNVTNVTYVTRNIIKKFVFPKLKFLYL